MVKRSTLWRGVVRGCLLSTLFLGALVWSSSPTQAGTKSPRRGDQSVAYTVSIKRTAQVEPSRRLASRLAREGFRGRKGPEATRLFLSHAIDLALREGAIDGEFLDSGKVLTIDLRDDEEPCTYILTIEAWHDGNGSGVRDSGDEYFGSVLFPYQEAC